MFAAIVGQSWADDVHPFNLEINGIDLVDYVQWPSIEIEMPGPGTNGSIAFTLEDKDSSLATINEWDEVRFIEHAQPTFPIVFGGFVQSPRIVTWAALGRSIQVRSVGYGILLDRKAVPSYPVVSSDQFIAGNVVSMVNRHGGRISTAAARADGGNLYNSATLPASFNVVNWTYGLAMPPIENVMLRQAIETMISGSAYYAVTPPWSPVSGSFWVNGAAQLLLYPDLGPDALAAHQLAQYFGGVAPGLTVDESGTLIVDDLAYERDDADRVTAAYIVGGSVAGTGYYRGPALERAGDLETIVNAPASLSADAITNAGAAAVQATTAATARGEAVIGSDTALDVYPGRNVRVTSPRAGLTAADWRITSVRINFRSDTYRTYTIGFGGNAPQRDAALQLARR